MGDFVICDRLEKDSFFLKELNLCQLRLIPDGDIPWFLLIPKINGMLDWDDLSLSDQNIMNEEINLVCKTMKNFVSVDKVNIGSLGNIVPQLHIHVIGRLKTDRAWPGAIWGTSANEEFNEELLHFWIDKFNMD